jgi:hypothetical protein
MVNKRPTNAFKYPCIDIPSLSHMFQALKAPSSGSLIDLAEIVVHCHESGMG